MMKELKAMDQRIARLVALLVERLRPRRIWLFGSRAGGESRRGSDIDLAVEGGRHLSFREERKLREALDEAAGIYQVDLAFFLDGLLEDDEVLLDMLEDRNRSFHIYDEQTAEAIFQRVRSVYAEVLRRLPEALENGLQA